MGKKLILVLIIVLAVVTVLVGLRLYQKKTGEKHVKVGFVAHGLASAGTVKREIIRY